MYVLKPTDGKYEVGAIVNGVWFTAHTIDDHGDALQMVNYLNGGQKMPDSIASKFCILVIPEDAPPKIIGPVEKRETRDNLARIEMLKYAKTADTRTAAKFYALTWRRDYLPEIRCFNKDEVLIRQSMYLARVWINDGEEIYSDQWIFMAEPDDSDDAYMQSTMHRYPDFKEDPHQDDTWINDDGRELEADGYSLVPLHHEHVIKEYIK